MVSTPTKKPYRQRRLFPRSLQEVVKAATKPMMDKEGKLMGALLAEWERIVGAERAKVTRPERLQFTNREGEAAILHLAVRPAAAPGLAYETEQMLEACARYFGYRAIGRMVLHPTHGMFNDSVIETTPADTAAPVATHNAQAIPSHTPTEMRGVLERLAVLVAKSDTTR